MIITFGFQSGVCYGLLWSYDWVSGIQRPFGLLTSFSVPLWSISVSFLVHVIVCGLLWSWGRFDPLSFISFIYFKFIFIVKIIIVATHIWWYSLYRLYFFCLLCKSMIVIQHEDEYFSLGGVEKYICYDMSCKSFFDL